MSDGTPRFDLLPTAPIRGTGPVGQAFLARGVRSVREAAEHVWRLPYARNERPQPLLAVLEEGRGTCSTKHALLARLLAEEGTAGFELRLGIYEMNEWNTPGVGPALARHGLVSIPEAHCYLVAGDVRLDVTRVLPAGVVQIARFLAEEAIQPGQEGAYKRAFHRRFFERFVGEHPEFGLSAEDLWAIREACIAALAA